MIRRNSCTVLLVDDAAEDRATYRRHLQSNRECLYRILEAETGEQALKAAGERRPDCILLDYRLPDVDGLKLLQALTRQGVDDPYAIVMLTGASEVTVAVQALKAGALDYLDKNDLQADQLHRAVQYAMGHAALRRELNHQRLWSRQLLRSISEAVIAGDASGRISFMNGAAEALTGWRAEMAVGQAIDKVYSVIDQETRQPVSLVPSARTGNAVEQRLVLVNSDGREVAVDHSYAPIKAARGDFIGSVIVAHDVTGKRQREANLRAREERYNLAMQAMGDAMWDWNVATNEFWSNETFAAKFGASDARSEGRPLALIHDEDRARVVAQTQAALARRDHGWSCYYRYRQLHGVYMSVLERGYIVRDADGQPLRVVAVMLDTDDCKTPASTPADTTVDFGTLQALARELRDGLGLVNVAKRDGQPADSALTYVAQLAERLLRQVDHHAAADSVRDDAAGAGAAADDADATTEAISK